MTNIFATGQPQDIPAVLANKDRRTALQQRLVAAHPGMTVVAAKLNIPGSIKNNRAIQRFFTAELLALERDWLTAGQLFCQDTGGWMPEPVPSASTWSRQLPRT